MVSLGSGRRELPLGGGEEGELPEWGAPLLGGGELPSWVEGPPAWGVREEFPSWLGDSLCGVGRGSSPPDKDVSSRGALVPPVW